MNNRDPIKMLEYEAKRKPLVGEMWGRLATLTDEEIDAAPLPMLWFKKAFRLARDKAQGMAVADNIAEIARANPIQDDENQPGVNATQGETYRYEGDTAFFKSSTGLLCEVKFATWLFFPDTGGVWDYQTFFADIPRAFEQRTHVASHTRHEYVLAWADELQRRY
jgi:hypothetical protein